MAAFPDPPPAVAPDARTPFFDLMTDNWPRWSPTPEVAPATVIEYLTGAHQRELAAQKPVVNVTVAGQPGHLSADTATGGVAWSPEPASDPTAPLAVVDRPPCE
jgi:hypothetical protein